MSNQFNSRNRQRDDRSPKPYAMVSFPQKPIVRKKPAGHERYLPQHCHGTLYLKLTVRTPLHVSTGVVATGEDVNKRGIPLIKTMETRDSQQLIIPGSSFKGVVRSVYEAITNSTLGAVKRERGKIPFTIPRDRHPFDGRDRGKGILLCPAERVFGAMNWQGLVSFNDAKCEKQQFAIGFMPSLYGPDTRRKAYYKGKHVAGRKFYYNFSRAVDKGQNRGVPVQQAGTEYTFTTQIQYKNLSEAELGTLLVILGQDKNNKIALKIGGGKPIGMGTVTTEVTKLENYQNIRDRYTKYDTSADTVSGEQLKELMGKLINTAHQNLIEAPQMKELKNILKYPTTTKPPEGMY
ncbi:MAG: RAMP superfamily CRISPR-associated protein [Cyanobacteria bacterium P01_A01_bin.84]